MCVSSPPEAGVHGGERVGARRGPGRSVPHWLEPDEAPHVLQLRLDQAAHVGHRRAVDVLLDRRLLLIPLLQRGTTKTSQKRSHLVVTTEQDATEMKVLERIPFLRALRAPIFQLKTRRQRCSKGLFFLRALLVPNLPAEDRNVLLLRGSCAPFLTRVLASFVPCAPR